MIETLSYMRKPQTPKKPPYAIESVDHALVVIQLLRDAGAARLVEIAREIGVSASTAHRILAMLVFRGFALQDDDRRYLPGPSIGVAPTTTSHNRLLMDVSRRRVEALTVATGETSNLMIRIGANARILYTAEGHHTLRVHDRRGAVLPARHASGGKALLAELDTQALQRLYLRRNHVDEPLSLDAFAALQAQLARIRMDGFALNIEETEAGIGAVGVCVRAADGTAIAAVTSAFPILRYADLISRGIVEEVKSTTHEIEQLLAEYDIHDGELAERVSVSRKRANPRRSKA